MFLRLSGTACPLAGVFHVGSQLQGSLPTFPHADGTDIHWLAPERPSGTMKATMAVSHTPRHPQSPPRTDASLEHREELW